ncbi:MAG: S9 family peptidase [Prevotella sp.]|nr:S9 family peptidase [Prevotella sp.]
MKRTVISFFVGLLLSQSVNAYEPMTLRALTSGEFYAEQVSGVNPLKGSDEYVKMSDDGRQIVQYSFKTGKPSAVLFDADNTIGAKIPRAEGYIMSPDGRRMLIQTKTERIYRRSQRATYYIYTIQSKKLEPLSENGPQQSPVWSDNGTLVAFVRDNNIFLVKLLYDNAESQVTKDGKMGEVINGIPDWVYEEEFSMNTAMAFNADGTMLCWIRFDESNVKTYSLQMFQGMNPVRSEYEYYPGAYSYKYPKAGQDNSRVSVWSYDIKAHRPQQLQVPVPDEGYVPRLKSTADPEKMLVYTMNRHQDNLSIYTVNPRSTLSQLIIEEKVPRYVKEEVVTGTFLSGTHIIMPSDRSGYMGIYIYNMNGELQRKVVGDKYDITAVCGYDDATGDIYYQAAALNPHDRQVYVQHRNGKTDRLTDREGWNTALFSADYKYFINTWSDYNTPFVVSVKDNRGKQVATLVDNHELVAKINKYGWRAKEPFSFTTSEGVSLDGWMIKPSDFNASKRYPVILYQYAGPGSQQVVNSWNAGSMGQGGAFDYYLAQQGFIVVCVDGRGTGGRGAEFEKMTYQRLGDLESKDQVETALWLGTQSYVDKDRIGIWGWSYGGFNTLMSMSEGREVFKAGVAVAPPTNWKYYDTVYTERFMRTPKENPEGYAVNPIERASRLHGSLLICHGLADDNVHPQNTFEYTEALVQANKDFREIIYTNRNHSIYGGNTRNHLLRQIARFFETELGSK